MATTAAAATDMAAITEPSPSSGPPPPSSPSSPSGDVASTSISSASSKAKQADPNAEPMGSIRVSQVPPTAADLARVAKMPVFDKDGKRHDFESVYRSEDKDARVLLLFIRHFFCGNCQEYLRTLTELLPPSLLPTSPPTRVAIIGCGQHDLITFYADATSCPYPIYADPSKRLYAELGMARTLSLGPEKPEYMRKGMLGAMWTSLVQNLHAGRKAFHGGDYWQVGGEMVFEKKGDKGEWEVGFCHRMSNTRDHTEMPVILKALGVSHEPGALATAKPDILPAPSSVGGQGAPATPVAPTADSGTDTAPNLAAAGGADEKTERPATKKRWSLVGSSAKRSLSVRREEWSRSRSRGKEERKTKEATPEEEVSRTVEV